MPQPATNHSSSRASSSPGSVHSRTSPGSRGPEAHSPEVRSPEEFTVPATHEDYSAEQEIKRSRFIGHVRRVDSEDEARAFIAEIKHLYPDARHHCSAFIVHVPGAQPVERSSDDGEPSGTAGGPMLDVLRGSGLQNICAVVVRYFGGIKLGTGGLVRAYSDAVAAVVELVPRACRRRVSRVAVPTDIADAGRIEAELRARGFSVTETTYGQRAVIELAVDFADLDRLDSTLAAVSKGLLRSEDRGEIWHEHLL